MSVSLRIVLGLTLFILVGCASVQETAKTLWGSSTRALDKARDKAVVQEFPCPASQCFDTVVAFVSASAPEKLKSDLPEKTSDIDARQAARVSTDEQHETALVNPTAKLQIFLKDSKRHVLVLMGVPGAIDTTEVGVFFTSEEEGKTKVEISSLSKQAKIRASEILFPELNKKFPLVQAATAVTPSLGVATGSSAAPIPQSSNP